MGKWSTYRHRGAVRQQAAALTVPPAPVLSFEDGDLLVTPTGNDDTGGTVNIYRSEYEEGPFTFAGSLPWGNPRAFTGPDSGYYYATETGNGSTYVGESLPSNHLEA